MRSRRFLLTFFCFHALLLLTVASRDVLWLISRGSTLLPGSGQAFAKASESLLGFILDPRLGSFNAPADMIGGYLHAAGIESGYSYFAPNVGDSYELVFEFTYPDGHLDYDSFAPANTESALRLAGLLDQVVKTRSDEIREVVVKMLAQSAWQRYPDVVHIKAILGALKLPGPSEYERGERVSHEFLYAYDFSLSDEER